MTTHVWDYALDQSLRQRGGRASRRKAKTVTQILRAAYQKHVRDRDTKLALKRCLRSK